MNEFDFSVLTAGEPAQFGKYGSLRLRYLKENKPTLYQALLQGHLLNAHLNEIDQQAHEVVEQIAQQLISKRHTLRAIERVAFTFTNSRYYQQAVVALLRSCVDKCA